jgi:hypothetical protein
MEFVPLTLAINKPNLANSVVKSRLNANEGENEWPNPVERRARSRDQPAAAMADESGILCDGTKCPAAGEEKKRGRNGGKKRSRTPQRPGPE